jgi:hypothetical protein
MALNEEDLAKLFEMLTEPSDGPVEFTADQRQGFRAIHQGWQGFVAGGFTPLQALVIVGTMIAVNTGGQ